MSGSIIHKNTDPTATVYHKYIGLTKRELFAAMLMQGLLSEYQQVEYGLEDAANLACGAADALINELNKND